MDAISQHALNRRIMSVTEFQHGRFKKVETIYIMHRRYEVTIFYFKYKPVNVVMYEIDDQGKKNTANFSTLTYQFWSDIRKQNILNRD